jgi:hypothetical protein
MADWSKKQIVPLKDLEAWYQFVEGASGDGFAPDFSGKGRDAVAATAQPTAWANAINGEYGWYFNGSRNPLVYSGAVTVKQVFMVAAFEEATFTQYRGLFTGLTGDRNVLVGDSSGTKFFHFGYAPNSYRKNGVSYISSNLQAPVNIQFAILEAKVDADHSAFDGLQIGKQIDTAGTNFKGWVVDVLPYSTDQNEASLKRIYEYFAMRYHLWEKTSAGLYVFPFAANKSRSLERDKENYLSDPYDGDSKALVRGSFRSRYELPFALRLQEEFAAAQAFWEQHYPLSKFVFRDYRYYPFKEVTCRFASPIREQGSDVTYRFNYSFEVVETT